MIRRSLVVLLCVLALAGCGGPPPDLNTPDPPGAIPYDQAANPAVNDLLTSLDRGIQALVQQRGYEAEDQPRLYSSTDTVAQIVQFYNDELVGKRGWEVVPNGLPDTSTRALLAYRNGDTLFVVTAIDISAYNGPGIVIYTLKATR